ncbi:MAG: YihY/virulence factor BrkB family protein [Melioribacteraceae bacterium]|nr:YihY/virulence factor BrkB family protein [Melioribacteraceae bacterium]
MSRFKIYRFITKYISLSTLRKVLEFFKHYFGGLFYRTEENHLFLSAAGIAYSLILSMIPMVLLAFSVLGNIIDVVTIEEHVNTAIENIIPYHDSADYFKRFILSRIPEVVAYKTIAGYLGSFGLLFTSTWLFSSMRTILNKIFKVTEKKSPFIGMIRDFGMVILVLFFILISTYILPTINFIFSLTDKIAFLEPIKPSIFLDNILSWLSVVIMFITFFLFYLLIPYEKLNYRVPLVSAFWATLLWELARSLFGYYVVNFLALNNLYGAFLFISVVMFWIFYASIVFLIAAEIGQLYRERRYEKMTQSN